MTDFIIGSGDLWAPFLTLVRVIEESIANPTDHNIERLDAVLKKHKPDFRAILATQVRNQTDRDELRKAINEAIPLIGHEGKKRLPQQMVNEALLISDIFDINELHAMDLLVTGEAEMGNYPGWGRGLIAVYIYFEGRNAMITAFNTVMAICPGNTWGSRVSPKVIEVCNSLLNQVLQDDFMDKVLRLLDKFEIKKQMELLDANLALGDWRHRTKIMTFATNLRDGLARILFCWSAQRILSWNDTFRLLEYLKVNIRLTEDFKVTKDCLLLIATVLFAIENNLNCADFDKGYATELRKYYMECEESTKFQCPELLDLIKLSYFVVIYKTWAERSLNTMQGSSLLALENGQTLIGDEDLEFRTDVFGFLKNEIFSDPKMLSGEEHMMRQFHQLLISFINFMPMKLKDMKNRSEDAVKTAMIYHEQGISRPMNLPRDYENFLESMGSFYKGDENFELAADYFRSGAEFVTLCKLVRSSCLDSPAMFVPNVKMLSGFAVSYTAGVFALLKQNGHNLSLEHFFDSIMKYLSNVGVQGPVFGGPSLYLSEAFHRVVIDPVKLNPSEVHGICAYLELLKTVCSTDQIRNYFVTTKKQWLQLTMNAGKVRSLPIEVRSRMLEAAAAMIPNGAISTENNMTSWDIFYSTHLVEYGCSDLRDELEEKETRLESYSLTIGFLKLLSALVASRFGGIGDSPDETTFMNTEKLDGDSLEPYISFVRDSVLLKLFYRSYGIITERWEKAKLALNILSNLLDVVPHIMVQMLSESPLFKTCLLLLVDCARVRELSTGPIPYIDECSYECLKLISRVYDRQSSYLYRRDRETEQNWVLLGIHELLQKINGDTGRPEYLIALLKFIDTLNPEKNRNLATHILTKIVSTHRTTDANLYAAVTSNSTLSDIVLHSLTKCLSDENSSEGVKKDVMTMLRQSVVHFSPNFGLFLLGVDKRIEFENPGVRNHPRTLLHTILENCSALSGAFQTLLVLIQDNKLSDPLLRYLRTNQFFVKFFLEEFPQPEMKVECMGYFFKCIAIELKAAQQPSPLAHAIVGESSGKFINILKSIQIDNLVSSVPNLEFFEQELVIEAMRRCEYIDRDLKIKLIDTKMLGETFDDEISKLERSTALRLKKSVQGEAKELLTFARNQNEARKTEAAKVLLFDCWRQCLEIIVLARGSLNIAGVDFVTTILRLLTDKMKVPRELSSESFHKLSAETTMVLCGVLGTFGEDLNSTMLNKVLQDLCLVVCDEQSSAVRAVLHSSILYVIKIMKEREGTDNSSNNLSIIIESLCKDSIHSADVGRMQAMYLLGEIIRWNINRGLGGAVQLVGSDLPIRRKLSSSGAFDKSAVSFHGDGTRGDFIEFLDCSSDSGIPYKKSILDSTSTKLHPSISVNSSKIIGRVASPSQTRSLSTDNFSTSQLSGPSILEKTTNLSVSTRSALMNHLHNKGFLKSIVEELSLVDDENLLKLFNNRPGSTHMRSLLVFEAKMFMLSRFARTGPAAARILMDSNLVLCLADMKVFDASTFPEIEDPLSTATSGMDALGFTSTELGDFHQPKVNRMDTLFAALFTLLLSMESSSRKNYVFYEQIWHFLEVHDQALAVLLEYPEYCQTSVKEDSLLLFTTLLARTSKKFPLSAFTKRMKIISKLAGILRVHADQRGLTELQIQIVKNVLVFFSNYATNIHIMAEEKKTNRGKHCHNILSPTIDQNFNSTKTDELSVGVVLKIVQDGAYRLAHSDNYSGWTRMDITTIIEIGLTLVYWHVERILKEMFVDSSGYIRDQQRFQFDLANFIEDVFVKYVTESSEVIQEFSYIQTMLTRLRRLAHLQKY